MPSNDFSEDSTWLKFDDCISTNVVIARDLILSESGISTVDALMGSLRRWSPRVSESRAARGVMVSPSALAKLGPSHRCSKQSHLAPTMIFADLP